VAGSTDQRKINAVDDFADVSQFRPDATIAIHVVGDSLRLTIFMLLASCITNMMVAFYYQQDSGVLLPRGWWRSITNMMVSFIKRPF
jgi:hypothetical protein